MNERAPGLRAGGLKSVQGVQTAGTAASAARNGEGSVTPHLRPPARVPLSLRSLLHPDVSAHFALFMVSILAKERRAVHNPSGRVRSMVNYCRRLWALSVRALPKRMSTAYCCEGRRLKSECTVIVQPKMEGSVDLYRTCGSKAMASLVSRRSAACRIASSRWHYSTGR